MAGMKLGVLARTVGPLTYFINMIELIGSRSRLVRLYEHWQAQWPLTDMSLWSSALYWLGVSLDMGGEPWPPPVQRQDRLVVIVNHPYGLLDGMPSARWRKS